MSAAWAVISSVPDKNFAASRTASVSRETSYSSAIAATSSKGIAFTASLMTGMEDGSARPVDVSINAVSILIKSFTSSTFSPPAAECPVNQAIS